MPDLRLRIEQNLQAAGCDSAEADQHRLAPRRAEPTELRLAHDLATETVREDQPFFRRQQSEREIARDREVEAIPPIPRRILLSRFVRIFAIFRASSEGSITTCPARCHRVGWQIGWQAVQLRLRFS